MEAEDQPGAHFGSVLFVLVAAETVLSVEVRDHAFQEIEPASRVRHVCFHLLIVGSLFLYMGSVTSASVGLMTKMWRLQESLLTASQLPSLLKAIE